RSKTYGDAVTFAGTEFTSTGLINGDAVNSISLNSAGAVATASVAGSAYSIVPSAATGSGLANYSISYANGALTVNRKDLVIVNTDRSKTYGEVLMNTDFAGSITGIQNSDNITLTRSSTGSAAGATAATTYPIAATLADPDNKLANYNVTNTNGTLTVNQKALAITATDRSKTYGDAVTFAGTEFTSTGLINGDAVNSISLNSTGAASTAAVSITEYDINAGNATGTGLDNYTISYVKGQLTVGKKALIVTAQDRTKVYGELTTFAGTEFTTAGLVNGDLVSLVSLSSPGAAATAAVSSTAYVIDAGDAIGTGLDNYGISYTTGQLAISKKALTVSADNKSKVYGEVNPDLTVTYAGLVNNETALNPALAINTPATVASGVGNYDINVSGTAANYDITFIKGELTISKKALTVTAGNMSKIYGDPNPDFTVSYTGLVNNEQSLNPAPTINTSANLLSGAGEYVIEAAGTADNYAILFEAGKLTINKRTLTITADDKSKFAGTANPALTLTYSGFVNGDDKSVLTSLPTTNTTATNSSPLGSYPITVSSAEADNYQMAYRSGTLTVNPGAPTSIALSSKTIFENQAAGTVAGTLSATSDDQNAVFTYSLVSGQGSDDNNLFIISGDEIKTVTSLNYEEKASYHVRVKSTTQHGFGLERTLTINVTDVNEIPTLNAITNQVICYTTSQQTVALGGISPGEDAGQSASITVQADDAAFFEILEVTGSSIRYKVNKEVTGTAKVTVTVTDNGGIVNGGINKVSRSFNVTINPLPVVSLTSDKGTELSMGLEANLTATGGASYQWSNAHGILGGQNSATLRIRPANTTTYRVTVTSGSGCSVEKEITIHVSYNQSVLEANNILSPNGDGKNDKFEIKNLDMYPNNTVKIFDRAGREIYSKKSYTNEWDGSFQGAPLIEDTYYYIVDFGPGLGKKKGFITIVRD
ncbi:T9SS type B sorting domain-containing protein, partial [Flavihumibacter sp. R14]|nr:T9SS type B sorting domain-containing protein [Flavihumibacter soli]